MVGQRFASTALARVLGYRDLVLGGGRLRCDLRLVKKLELINRDLFRARRKVLVAQQRELLFERRMRTSCLRSKTSFSPIIVLSVPTSSGKSGVKTAASLMPGASS
jgi:hypothetical protein